MSPQQNASVVGLMTAFSKSTKLAKNFTVLMVFLFLLGTTIPFFFYYFALVPGRTIPVALNLVTCSYVEKYVLNLCANLLGLLLIARILEPLWGYWEFLFFIIFVNFFTAIFTFITMIVLFYLTLNEDYLYAQVCGFHGAVSGLLVAIKQLMPEQEHQFLSLALRAKWAPSVNVLIHLLVSMLFATPYLKFRLFFVFFGTYGSWIYLRYFQAKPESAIQGDPSEEFSFATFFPEFMRPPVAAVAHVMERICCGKNPRPLAVTDAVEDLILGVKHLPVTMTDAADASRRRERGARALEERLLKARTADSSAAPPGPSSVSAAAAAADASSLPISSPAPSVAVLQGQQ
eukprot:TRINITY_DN6712_c0_g1_i2.p1 TRINITY_DN6712_c0_g1~~TRINITY_DN6712_c0_g1_i2.p1  ORF type:complete len:346 (+),score=43.95 TRINITY_DN6712_c0_g1_i2:282-1319(+)